MVINTDFGIGHIGGGRVKRVLWGRFACNLQKKLETFKKGFKTMIFIAYCVVYVENLVE